MFKTLLVKMISPLLKDRIELDHPFAATHNSIVLRGSAAQISRFYVNLKSSANQKCLL